MRLLGLDPNGRLTHHIFFSHPQVVARNCLVFFSCLPQVVRKQPVMCLHCGYFPVGNAFGDQLECFFQTVDDTVNYDWHSCHSPQSWTWRKSIWVRLYFNEVSASKNNTCSPRPHQNFIWTNSANVKCGPMPCQVQTSTCHWHLPSTYKDSITCSCSCWFLTPLERNLRWKAEVRHAVCSENWQNKTSEG